MAEKTAAQRLKALEKAIQEATVEVQVREKRLEELRPKRAALEASCRETFKCSIKQLQIKLDQDELALAELLTQMEVDLTTAQGE